MKLLTLLLTLTLLSGCSLLQSIPAKAKDFTDSYCEKPLAERELYRQNVNTIIDPHRLWLQCFGDTPPTETTLRKHFRSD